jgi:hypothetical protein
MPTIQVELKFHGIMLVSVPDDLLPVDAKLLAEKRALSWAYADFDNEDAPDEDACSEFLDEAGGEVSEETFDEAYAESFGGSWAVVSSKVRPDDGSQL